MLLGMPPASENAREEALFGADDTGSFRFLHAADLHLDSPMRGLREYEGAPATRLRDATRSAFQRLVSLALEHEVAFLILAGDLFDGEWNDFSSGLWLQGELRRLTARGIHVFIVRGNHDAESRVASRLTWPEGITEFGSKKPGTVVLKELGVAVHGQSYADQHVSDNLAAGYPNAKPGLLNVGILHTSLEGGYQGHDPYAPCSLDDLRARGYDYWALGHIHRREVVGTDPWVVFPGNVQGRHVGETGPKGATLVQVEGGEIVAAEPLVCDVARWEILNLDLSGVEDEDTALAQLDGELRQLVRSSGDLLLAVRVVFTGSTPLNERLRAQPHRISAEVRGRASAISEDLWIERVKCATAPLDSDTAASTDALAVLATRVREATLTPEALDGVANDLRKVSNKLPPEVRAVFDPADTSTLATALPDATRLLAALLLGGDQADAENESDAPPGAGGAA